MGSLLTRIHVGRKTLSGHRDRATGWQEVDRKKCNGRKVSAGEMQLTSFCLFLQDTTCSELLLGLLHPPQASPASNLTVFHWMSK